MLTYILNSDNSIPLYEQIYKYIKDDILSGKLSANLKLPSKRKLSANLGVSVITIETAYSQLISEGYIYSQPKKGYFVSHIEKKEPQKTVYYKNVEEASPSYKYEFRMNTTDTEYFPFSTWAKTLKFILSEKDKKLLEKTSVKGVYELRCEIAKYLKAFRNIDVSPNQIITGAGSEYLVLLLLQLLGEDKIYALETPGYAKISEILKKNNIKTQGICLDESGLSVEELKKTNADIVHVTPSHHFPLGIIMPIGRRRELLNWAEKNNGYIIEDDYDSEFRYIGRPIPPLKSLDEGECVIYLNTFAKSLAPSLRISYMVLPPALMDKFEKEFTFYSNTVSSFEQYTLAYFMKNGHFERYVNRMKAVYKKRCEYISKRITKGKFKGRTSIFGQKTGMHIVLMFKCDLTEKEIEERAKEKGVLIYALERFCGKTNFSKKGYPMILLGFSAIKCSEMEKAFDILENIIFNEVN